MSVKAVSKMSERELRQEVIDSRLELSQLRVALIAAVSAMVHYEEFLDTQQGVDLVAARTSADTPQLKDWMRDNEVLVPLRRNRRAG